MAFQIDRAAYASMFGPPTGDRVRLADTELFIEVYLLILILDSNLLKSFEFA